MRTQRWICHGCEKAGSISVGIEEDDPGLILAVVREDHKMISPECQVKPEFLFDLKNPEDLIFFRRIEEHFSPKISIVPGTSLTDSIGE